MLLFPSAAFATDVQPCQINDWSPNYPNQVNPGQTVQVTSTINISCGQWRTYYTARVDLVNRSTGQYYSTSEFQIGWQPGVNATITNAATAPPTGGEWKLQYNLYIFEEGSQDGNPFRETFNINVGTPSAPGQQNVTTVTSTQQQMTPNTTAAMAQAPPATMSTDPGLTVPEGSYIALALAAAALVGVAVLIVARKRLE